MFKVIIAGSRSFNNYEMLKAKCSALLANRQEIVIVSGCAQGADRLGEQYAKEMGYPVERHPANWDKYGKSAGFRRNEEMAKCSEALIAFWDGQSRGTKHMIEYAKKNGLAVRVIKVDGPEEETVEIKYNDVKDMGFYFHDNLSRLANHMYTVEQLQKRKEAGKPTSLMQAIAELIAPDNAYKGTYKCYSQRAFDQGNAGDPYEYTGIQVTAQMPNGMNVTIDTHYGDIKVTYKNDLRYSMSMGQKLMSELDKIGEALWADWDDNPDSITKKLRDVEDEETWLESNEDYKYNEARVWSRPTDERNYSKLESKFERDVRGGIKYTNREEDPVAGRNFNYKLRIDYKEIIAEQKAARAEAAKKQMVYRITPVKYSKSKTWATMTEEEREAARAKYRAVAAMA